MPGKKVPERHVGLRPSENFRNGIPASSITKMPLVITVFMKYDVNSFHSPKLLFVYV
jgi:hypothetical protein